MKSAFPWLRMVPLICVMGTIFFLSHQTASDLDIVDLPFIDKVGHFIIYGVLALAALFAFGAKSGQRPSLLLISSVVLFCMLYGISDEYHQTFIAGRDASVGDLAADVLGAAFFSLVWDKLCALVKIVLPN